jgi:hypothetical protein
VHHQSAPVPCASHRLQARPSGLSPKMYAARTTWSLPGTGQRPMLGEAQTGHQPWRAAHAA